MFAENMKKDLWANVILIYVSLTKTRPLKLVQ